MGYFFEIAIALGCVHWNCSALLVAEDAPAKTVAAVPASGAKPGPNDRQITLAVRSYLEREHLNRRPIDAEISSRWFKTFLEALDPMKVYLMQADIDEFQKRQSSLAEVVKRGDVSFAYDVSNRLLQRLDQRLPLIKRFISEPHDFTQKDSIIADRDETKWAASEAEAEDLWRRRVKYDLLIQKMEKMSPEEAKEKLTRRYSSFAKRMHQMTADELLETYLSALTSSLDPHTSYMSPGTLENFEISMRLQLDGIGASLRGEDGFTTVAELVPGGAADKDGRLQPKDRVIGVGQGATGELTDVVDMNLNEVVKLIRGKRSTIVRLKVIPVGQTVPKIYDITRDKIELKDSEARGEVIEEGKKIDGSPFKIGVINLPSFYMDMAGARQGQAEYKSTTRDCKRLLDEFRQKGVDCVVLDLRNNGGGSLPESISLTGLFMDTGPVVQIKDADKRIQQYDDVDPDISWDGPLVVLINKFSASASEIVAGAIQDYRRGLVVGDKATHGKGTVQSLLDLGRQLFQRLPNAPSLGAIKITMQQFYRPLGESTQLEGVKSDVELPSLTTHLEVGESDLDYALAFDKVPAASFKSSNRLTPELVKALQDRSTNRVEKNEDFQKVERDIAQYRKRKSEKTISLVEEDFVKSWNESKSVGDEEEKLERSEDPKRPIVKRDYYFAEAMRVTLDYLTALSGGVASLAQINPEAEPAAPRAVPVLQ